MATSVPNFSTTKNFDNFNTDTDAAINLIEKMYNLCKTSGSKGVTVKCKFGEASVTYIFEKESKESVNLEKIAEFKPGSYYLGAGKSLAKLELEKVDPRIPDIFSARLVNIGVPVDTRQCKELIWDPTFNLAPVEYKVPHYLANMRTYGPVSVNGKGARFTMFANGSAAPNFSKVIMAGTFLDDDGQLRRDYVGAESQDGRKLELWTEADQNDIT